MMHFGYFRTKRSTQSKPLFIFTSIWTLAINSKDIKHILPEENFEKKKKKIALVSFLYGRPYGFPNWATKMELRFLDRMWICLKILYNNFLFLHHEAKDGLCVIPELHCNCYRPISWNLCRKLSKCGAFCSAIQANIHPVPWPCYRLCMPLIFNSWGK